jgi:hypothetical protein
LGSHWCGFGGALGWLCTPESMPSICLLYGFGVALGGLPPFLVQGSRFEVQRSTFSLRPEPQTPESRLPPICRKPDVYYQARRRLEAPPGVSMLSTASLRRVSGESPVSGWGNCDETRIAPIGTKGSGPASAGRQSQSSCKSVASVSGAGPVAVRCGSGGGPMWIAQDSVSTQLTTLTFWLCAPLSAPCVNGAAPTQARRVPHVDCASHWH